MRVSLGRYADSFLVRLSGVPFFTLKKLFIDYIEYNGCARRGASGALFPKSADAGLNSL
jgi:hypothetical protein